MRIHVVFICFIINNYYEQNVYKYCLNRLMCPALSMHAHTVSLFT